MADVIFFEGWAKYGNAGDAVVLSATALPVYDVISANGWTMTTSGSVELSLVSGPTPASLGLRGSGLSSGGSISLARRSLGSNLQTFTIGFYLRITSMPIANVAVVLFEDGTSDQCCLAVGATGILAARSGGASGTLLASSAGSLSLNVWYFIEVTTVVHNTTGSMTVDVNGANVIAATNVNTRAGSTNAYATVYNFFGGGGAGAFDIGPLYVRDDSTRLGDATVETKFVDTDHATQFTFGAMTIGTTYRGTTATNAPGANQLALRPFTCPASGNLDSVAIIPQATSAGAKFKAVVYADLSNAPNGAPIATGTEVTGTTAGTTRILPFGAPPALTAGTVYWIGFITDTSVVLALTDVATNGYKAANTYGSGAPTTPSMTSGQSSWVIYGKLSGVTTLNDVVNVRAPGGDLNYLYSATVGHEDLFTIGALSDTPLTIYRAAVWAYTRKTDAGARTIDLRLKSGGTTSSGSNAGQSPSVSYAWYGSIYSTDPNTGAAWAAGGVNAMKIGYKIVS